jgi:hypothetical protein
MTVDNISFQARTLTVFRELGIKTTLDLLHYDFAPVVNTTVGGGMFYSGVRVSRRVIEDINQNLGRLVISN